MISSIYRRPTMTAIVVCVFVALALSVAPASATSSIIGRDLEDTTPCEDNPHFCYKNKCNKDCDWISAHKKKKKLCRKKKDVRENCPETCDLCDLELSTKCPKKFNSKKFNKPCDDYENGLRCEYNRIYTGCDTNDIACVPQQWYSCFEDPTTGDKEWSLATVDLVPCPERPYGDSCDPSACPPIAPLPGGPCGWYDGTKSCGYNPIWWGCLDNIECRYREEYTCNPLSNTWDVYVAPQLRCATLPGVPVGQTCEIGDVYTPSPTRSPVPEPDPCDEEPTRGDHCAFGADETCYGGYSVRGCNPDSLYCSPGVVYSCSPYDIWYSELLPQIKCISDDPRWGTECDPDEPIPPLPSPEPEPCENEPYVGSNCKPDADETCYGQYLVQGCTSDDLFCSPGVSYSCSEAGSWEVQFLSQILCISDDPRWGTACDPDEPIPPPPPPGPCDYEPEEGENCMFGVSETCYGGYAVSGCTTDTLFCAPGVSYSCSQDEEWEIRFLPQIKCIPADDPLWGTPCDPLGCPPSSPTADDTCSLDGGETCYYNYEIRGCVSYQLECTALAAFECGWNHVWVDVSPILPACVASDIRWGTDCDPNDCPVNKPTDGEECDSDKSCYYDYEFFGCTTDTIECTPTTALRCVDDGSGGTVWSEDRIVPPPCYLDDRRIGEACESTDNLLGTI